MKSSIISRASLLALMVISAIIMLLFYFGGSDDSLNVGDESFDIPVFTNTMIYWAYCLMALVCTSTIVSIVLQYSIKFKTNPKAAIKSLVTVVLLAIVLLISYIAGSEDTMEIIGYEGTDNGGFWARFTDMCLYSIYILVCCAVLALIGTFVYKMIKK